MRSGPDGAPHGGRARPGAGARAALRHGGGPSLRAWLLTLLCAGVGVPGCSLIVKLDPVSDEPIAEGQPGCSSSLDCADGLFCVPRVGPEYGFATEQSVCERSTLPYGFLTTGTRASRDLTEDAIAGIYRLPRALESTLATARYSPLSEPDAIGCGAAGEPGCEVPHWAWLWGKGDGGEFTLPSKYDRFSLFGFRFVSQFFDVYHRRPDRVIEESMGPAGEARRRVEQLLFALFDSFSLSAPAPLALPEDPAPEDRGIGFRNPNYAWAPTLDQWDAAQNFRNRDGPGAKIPGVSAFTYADLRDSVWDRHATAFRAMQFAGALRHFRGFLDDAGKARWTALLHDMGLALSLPSAFEETSNHGVSEALALLVLSTELRGSGLPSELLDAWRVLGTHRLNQVIGNTLYAGDGVQRERSAFYHNYQLGLLVEVRNWLRQHELSLTDVIPNAERAEGEQLDVDPTLPQPEQRLTVGDADPRLDADDIVRKMMDFAAAVTLPNGDVPLIGAGQHSSLRTYQHAVFESLFADESPEAQRLAHVVSGGEQGALPEYGVRVFPDSGFVVLRGAHASSPGNDAHVVFNAGFPAHSKSHPDALAVHLFGPDSSQSEGRVLLGDSGWFSYRRPERRYFESTVAHNTVSVARESQCMDETSDRSLGPGLDASLRRCDDVRASYASAGPAEPGYPAGAVHLGSTQGGAGWTYQSALHGLYPGVTHARAVLLGAGGWLLVVDDVATGGEGDAPAREVELYWHLGQGLRSREPRQGEPYRFEANGSEPVVSIDVRELGGEMDAAGRCAIVEGSCADARCEVPLQGFVSPAEDEMVPVPVVECASVAKRVLWATLVSFGEAATSASLTRLERLAGAGVSAEENEPLRVTFQVGGREHVASIVGLGGPGESVRFDE